MKLLIYIAIFTLTTFSFAQNESLFEEGNTLYNAGEFDAAIKKYDAIIGSGVHSSEVYFNLGNAHYKLNHIAPSIYYFEKALQLAPNDKEIKQNIAFARNMTIDEVDAVPDVGISKLVKNISNKMSFDAWAIASVVLALLFVVLIISYYFSYTSSKKRIAFVGGLSMLVLACITLAFAFHNYNLRQNDQPAIVFAQETQVKSEPNLRSTESFKLHEGTKVQILDTVNNWKKIRLADGKTGWIPKNDIKAL